MNGAMRDADKGRREVCQKVSHYIEEAGALDLIPEKRNLLP